MGKESGTAQRVLSVGGEPTPVSEPIELTEEKAQELKEFVSDQWGPLKGQEELSSGDYYFNSYAHFGIHEEMIKDSVRTGAYQKAILTNKHLFEGKIVLDVGAGTGILSMFAAKAGAKHVYAIECSEIASMSRRLIKANGLGNRITVIQAKAEEADLPVDKVDIIISEWMGYFLLYESMLDTVLYCRDRWLTEEGLLFPDKASLFVAGIEDGDYMHEKFDFWDRCYGLDYSLVKQTILEEPTVDSVDAKNISTDVSCILQLDLKSCTVADVDFSSFFKLEFQRNDYVHAFVAWFDCTFSACHVPVVFSTSPTNSYTHWKQTVIYLEIPIVANQGEIIDGMIAVKKSKNNHRDLDIKIEYEFQGELCQLKKTQLHRLR